MTSLLLLVNEQQMVLLSKSICNIFCINLGYPPERQQESSYIHLSPASPIQSCSLFFFETSTKTINFEIIIFVTLLIDLVSFNIDYRMIEISSVAEVHK